MLFQWGNLRRIDNIKKGKNEGSRQWGDWEAYFHRSLGINRSEGMN